METFFPYGHRFNLEKLDCSRKNSDFFFVDNDDVNEADVKYIINHLPLKSEGKLFGTCFSAMQDLGWFCPHDFLLENFKSIALKVLMRLRSQ